MKIYGKNIDELTTEELEHRLGFLKRNIREIDSLRLVELSFNRHQEILIIEEYLNKKGA